LFDFIALAVNRLWTKQCTAAASRRIAKSARSIPQKHAGQFVIEDFENLYLLDPDCPQDPRHFGPMRDV
jgi:hypothetical protein